MFKQFLASQFGRPKGFVGKIFGLIMNKGNRHVYDGILEMLDVKPDQTLLEVGFGNGRLLLDVLKSNPDKLCGIEVSDTMFDAAQKLFRKAGVLNRIEIKKGNVNSIPYDPNVFDTIYTCNTIYFWDNLESGLKEIRRILKPGGSFINGFYTTKGLNDHSFTRYNFKKYELKDFLSASMRSGFKITGQTEITKDKTYCIKLRKE